MTREEMRNLAAARVATWPALSTEQADRLHVLLAPMRAAIAMDRPARLGRAS